VILVHIYKNDVHIMGSHIVSTLKAHDL